MNMLPLTISLFSQITDQDLQSNYLNKLDHTAEIVNLLAQITDQGLVLRIINLAFEVDFNLGANLTSFITPELQAIAVQKIDQLIIPTGLKIELWRQTKSKFALSYLQNIFVFKYRYQNDGYRTIKSAISAIIEIDQNYGVSLLVEGLYDARFYHEAMEILKDLASEEEIGALDDLLTSPYLIGYRAQYDAIAALAKIGTEAAIAKIREALHRFKYRWSDPDWIEALGIVGEPAMVEHLIYLFYRSEEYIYRSTDHSYSEEHHTREAAMLCREAILGLERIGGEKVFDWLHQALYWVPIIDYNIPFSDIVQALFRLDRDRTFTALEGAIQSYDPIVRERAAMALSLWYIPIEDRNLLILLTAIDDPIKVASERENLDVQLEIVDSIRRITRSHEDKNINPQLYDQAFADTKTILLKNASHTDQEIRDRVVLLLWAFEPDERPLIVKLLSDVTPENAGLERLERLSCRLKTTIECSDLPALLEHLDYDLVQVRATAVSMIGQIGDDSILPILLELVHDPELSIRKAAVQSIVKLGTVAIFPTLLELATNPELVVDMIWELALQVRPSFDELLPIQDSYENLKQSPILEEFKRNPELTQKFLETAETVLIEILKNKSESLDMEIRALGEIGSDRAISTLQQIIRDSHSYDQEEHAVNALAAIGSDRAILTLLEFLPDITTLGGYISRAFKECGGKLGLVPKLWLAQCQAFYWGTSDAILNIQKQEGLYNPNFSNDQSNLFEQRFPQLRQILLGDTNKRKSA